MGNKLFTEILENAPANEPERQFYFIEQIKALLDVKKGEGYEAKAMVTVIGCQMSANPQPASRSRDPRLQSSGC